jgi:hypothetical protein
VTTVEGKATLDKERAKGEDTASTLAPTHLKEGREVEGQPRGGGRGSKESDKEGVKATEGSIRARTGRIERHPGPHGVIPT